MAIAPGVFIHSAHGPVGDMVARKDRVSGRLQLLPRRRVSGPHHAKCECKVFKVADTFYKAAGSGYYSIWEAAKKKRHISGYDLYMKEAMTLLNHGYSAPMMPTDSGGFSALHACPMPTFYPHQCTHPLPGQVITGTFGWTIERQGPYYLRAVYRHSLTDELEPGPFPVRVKAKLGWIPDATRYVLDIDDILYNHAEVVAWAGTIYEPLDIGPAGTWQLDTPTASHAQQLDKGGRYSIPLPPLAPGAPWDSVWSTRPTLTLKGRTVAAPQARYDAAIVLQTTRGLIEHPSPSWQTTITLKITDTDTGANPAPLYNLRQFWPADGGPPLLDMCGRLPHGHPVSQITKFKAGCSTAASFHLYYKGSHYHVDLKANDGHTWDFPRPIR